MFYCDTKYKKWAWTVWNQGNVHICTPSTQDIPACSIRERSGDSSGQSKKLKWKMWKKVWYYPCDWWKGVILLENGFLNILRYCISLFLLLTGIFNKFFLYYQFFSFAVVFILNIFLSKHYQPIYLMGSWNQHFHFSWRISAATVECDSIL